ncbi:MAG: RNA polymerase sigma factor RpoD/SigA [Bacilli bacterium]
MEVEDLVDIDETTIDIGQNQPNIVQYLNDIKQYKLLSREEELELAARKEQGDMEARNKLINANLRLVVYAAKKYANFNGSLDDLIEEGNLGLIKAVDMYSATYGYRFSTYGLMWIKNYIISGIGKNKLGISVAPKQLYTISLLNKARGKLQIELNREPTALELSHKLNMTEAEVIYAKSLSSRVLSLNQFVSDDSDTEFGDTLEESIDYFEHVENMSLKEEMNHLLAKADLLPKDLLILKKRYGFNNCRPMMLEEIGREFGYNKEEIRQREVRSLKKLRISKHVVKLLPYIDDQNKGLEYIKICRFVYKCRIKSQKHLYVKDPLEEEIKEYYKSLESEEKSK